MNIRRSIVDVVGDNILSVKNSSNEQKVLSTIDGQVIVDNCFDEIRRMSDGLIVVSKNNLWGAVDKNGEVKIGIEYSDLGDFSQGLAAVSSSSGKFGYIDKTGSVAIDCAYEKVSEFHEELAVVVDWNTGKSGYINPAGDVVIKLGFDRSKRFSEGLAPVYVGGEAGFIDKNGSFVITPQFKHCSPFFEGLAGASLDEEEKACGFINESADWVILPHYHSIENFKFGICLVHGSNLKSDSLFSAYIDKYGCFVWGPGDSWW